MKYRELPTTTGTGKPQPKMMCRDCGAGPWSAEKGDYWNAAPDDTVFCECSGEMILVRHERRALRPAQQPTAR